MVIKILLGILLIGRGDAFSPGLASSAGINVRREHRFKNPKTPTSSERFGPSFYKRDGGALYVSTTPDASFYPPNFVPQRKKQKLTRVEKEKILQDYRVPKVRDVLAFAIPAVGVWLCAPLLSMITTSCVGLMAGTTQQASLNPAMAVVSYSTKALGFLFSGTTTMIAAAIDGDSRDDSAEADEKPRTAKTLIGSLQISIISGIILGALVLIFSQNLLGLIIGGGTVDPAIMGPAEKFVKIRALGLPAAAMLGSAQTACLAQGDAKMPVLATIISAFLNVCLSLVFIRNSHPWLGGVAGAAVATTLSQCAAAWWAVRWLTNRKQQTKHENGNKSSSSFASHSTKGFLAGRMSFRDLFKMPSNDTSKGFAPFVIPVITTQLGRCSAVAAMDNVVSSSLGAASMAAHQILTSVYYSLVPVAESLSLAAQNFVPGITERDSNPREKSYAMKKLLQSFLKAAGLCGLFLAAVMGTLPAYCGAFTSDGAVRSLVSAVVPLIFVTCLKHGIFCASEGILLGQKDLQFLGRQYGVYTFVVPYLMFKMKKAALGGSTQVGLATVWQLFLGYDLFRTLLMAGRILWLERKRSKERGSSSQQAAYESS